jgi:hypothetical protein
MKKDEKILKWRLAEKPTAQTLQDLVKSQIITKDEARQILLDETEFNSKSFDDVLEEMKLLRKLVLEISEREPQKTIEIIEKHYHDYPTWPKQYPWSKPYIVWCNNQAQSGSFSLSSQMMNAARTISGNLN